MKIDFTRRILVSGMVAAVMALCLFQMPSKIARGITTVGAQTHGKEIDVLSWDFGVGLVRGQTLRITVSDPNQLPANSQAEPTRARVRLLLPDGRTIRESPEFVIPQGGFHFVDFSRADLPVSGDSLTGRVQVLAQGTLFIRHGQALGSSPVSGEVINEITGETQIHGFFGPVRVAAVDAN